MKKVILIAALICSPLASVAAQFGCVGTLHSSWTKPNGDFFVLPSWGANHVQVCNVKQEWKGVDSTVCMVWVSTAQAAVVHGKSTTMRYQSSGATTGCSNMPHYGAASPPLYMMLNKG